AAVRELAAAAVLLVIIAVGALAPILWQPEAESTVLASGTPRPTTAPTIAASLGPPSWHGRDGGVGFVVCGSSDTWTRPSMAIENAHLTADARYRGTQAGDDSQAGRLFRAAATLYDGSGASSGHDFIEL